MIACAGQCGANAGLHHSEHRNRKLFHQGWKSPGGGGVARHHDSLHSLRDQKLHRLTGEPSHRLGRLGPVRNPSGITQVNKILMWKRTPQLTGDGQPTQTAVKHADGTRRVSGLSAIRCGWHGLEMGCGVGTGKRILDQSPLVFRKFWIASMIAFDSRVRSAEE